MQGVSNQLKNDRKIGNIKEERKHGRKREKNKGRTESKEKHKNKKLLDSLSHTCVAVAITKTFFQSRGIVTL